MNVELAYGSGKLNIDLPSNTSIVEPTFIPKIKDVNAAISYALTNPLNSLPLKDIAQPQHKIAISICDITRPMPTKIVLPIMLKEIEHVPKSQIFILVATGTHRSNTKEELIEILGEDIYNSYQIICHDAFDQKSLKKIGTTSNNIDIFLNSIWVEADIRITTGFVEPHFFAGFSGGPKMVAPGLAGFQTIMKLHSAEFISNPYSKWGILDKNPIHQSIKEIAQKSKVDFSLDVTINKNQEITNVYAGNLFTMHKKACVDVKTSAMQKVKNLFDVVITSNSGYPLDQNLYQTVKGLSAAAQVVKNGGTIKCASECRDGLPSHGEYSKILSESNSISTLLEAINQSENTRHDQWQVQVQARIQMRAEVLIKSDFLTDEQIRAAHFNPISNIESALEKSINKHGKSARICVLPEGPQTIPYLSKHI